MKRPALALALVLSVNAAPHPALAQPAHSAEADRAEARERFDRGLRLFNAGENAGALAEFKRAYDLIPNVLVLYNMGLVYAQMGRPVEATDALGRVLANPGTLSPERLATARHTLDDQAPRIAEVSVDAGVDGASIQVDGVEAAKTPLAGPLRVTSGTHVIGVVAPGFSPQRKEVTIAGGEKQALKFDLVAMQGRLAHLTVKTHVPGADVFVDDQRIGATPLATSVSLAPGARHIELRRSGYVTAREDVTLPDGATGEVTLEPDEDPSVLAAMGGMLALDLRETQTVVTVDGRPRGVYAAPLRLMAGPHHLLLERGDFEPFERDVSIEPGATVTVSVRLEPTPEYRARFASHAQAQRTWGLVSLIGGAVLVGGGVGLVVYDANQRSSGHSTINGLVAKNSLGQICDPGQLTTVLEQNCLDPISVANTKINDANTRDYAGWSAVGLGAAAVALGVTLLVTGDDPHKYDRQAPDAEKAGARVVPTLWTARGGGGAAIVGSF
jgi:hypothetical protein